MATKHKLSPSASSLSESMRDLGYSLETAVADIVDNSITAKATKIDIYCDLDRDNPALVIIDNGYGMSYKDLIKAMKHGSLNPKEERSPMDLGRFGLGLKTASFSQCRCLTVLSSQNFCRVAAEWDLDLVNKEDDWILSILDEQEIRQLPYVDQLPETGTVVIWRKLDRLFQDQEGAKKDEIVNEKLDLLEKHLALVFHRFLTGEISKRKKISIRINRHEIEPFDPFCRRKKATRILPEEKVSVKGEDIRIQPYILPHHSKLSAAEYDYYQDRSDFISNQGAYIYRNGRLMAWGDWFRLVPKGEATKLARVQIDFTNALDQEWSIDIKKSKAKPPHEVRERIKQIISKIAEGSMQIHRGRGRKLFEESKVPIWERYAGRGHVQYELNKNHPLLIMLEKGLTEKQARKLRVYLDSVTSSLPVEMIYSDFSADPREIDQSIQNYNVDKVLEQLRKLKNVFYPETRVDAETFRDIVNSTQLFTDSKDAVNSFIKEEFHE